MPINVASELIGSDEIEQMELGCKYDAFVNSRLQLCSKTAGKSGRKPRSESRNPKLRTFYLKNNENYEQRTTGSSSSAAVFNSTIFSSDRRFSAALIRHLSFSDVNCLDRRVAREMTVSRSSHDFATLKETRSRRKLAIRSGSARALSQVKVDVLSISRS